MGNLVAEAFRDERFDKYKFVGYTFSWEGVLAATVECYPEIYSIYWTTGVGIQAFVTSLLDMSQLLVNRQVAVSLRGFSLSDRKGKSIHDIDLAQVPVGQLEPLIYGFGELGFLRIYTPFFDAWATEAVPGVESTYIYGNQLAGVISDYSFARELASLYVKTSKVALAFPAEQQAELEAKFHEGLKECLVSYKEL